MKLLRDISIFVVGAAVGVGGSYKFFETKFSKIADEEIESIKVMARRNSRLSGVDVDGEPIQLQEVDKQEEKEPLHSHEEIRQVHQSYNEISAAYKSKVAENMSKESRQKTNYKSMSDKEDAQIEIDKKNIIDKLQPIVISDKSFVEDCLDYDKLTLHYYAGDKVLLDDNEDVFEDYEEYVGHDIDSQFGAFGVGDNLLYVRNDKFESDYEIIKFEESYI